MRHTPFTHYAVALAATAAIAGCTLKNHDAPDLAGPSELATSITLAASPDTIPQDGAAQSVVTVVARDASNQPIANLGLRVDVVADGTFANGFGRLSARNITTGSDGRSSVVYTAPQGLFGDATPESVVRIFMWPVGTNFDNANPRSVSIRLVAPATIYAPGSPIASFTYSPGSPKAGENVFFNASSSSDPDGSIVQWQWTYGDGDVETGETQIHDFPKAGIYYVVLTVTDNAGNKASTAHAITVS